MARNAQQRVNSDRRYDLFISFHGSEELCPGLTTRELVRETRDQAFERSGGLASIFYDEEETRGSIEEKILEAIMQTRGGGVALFLLTADFFTRRWCLRELNAIMDIHARGKTNDNGESFKLRFVCFDTSADNILGHAKSVVPRISDYVIHCVPRSTRENMAYKVTEIVDRAWNEDPRNVFGDTVLASFVQLGNLFRDDVTIARMHFKVAGDDIFTVLNNALGNNNFSLGDVKELKRVASMSTNRMAVIEKRRAVDAYTIKWIESRGWSWSVAGAIGVDSSS